MFTDPELMGAAWEESVMRDIGDDLAPAELVLLDVDAECERQDGLWGDQSHLPLGTDAALIPIADEFRRVADEAHKEGKLTWTDILSEEFYEAVSEEDPAKLEEELIQLAAVAVQMAKSIRLNRARGQVD